MSLQTKKGEDENGGRSGIGEVYIEYKTTGYAFNITLDCLAFVYFYQILIASN